MTVSHNYRTTLGAPGRKGIKHVHFVGIGGVGMSGIAEVLLREGYQVSGSDSADGAATKRLRQQGAEIFIGHHAENITKAEVVVTSTAIDPNNPEVVAARAERLPIVRRAEMLAELMRFRYGIAISGTHGKTTTTSLVSSILAQGKLDPTFVIGGKLNSHDSNACLGKGRYLVTEADESDASFLHLLPMMTVVTNVDLDHMSTYDGDVEKLHTTFVDFLHQLPFYGLAIVCNDDEGVQSILPRIARPTLTYGFNKGADVRAVDVKAVGMQMQFTVLRKKSTSPLEVTLNLPGEHNVLNALSAICVAMELGVSDEVISQALKDFAGVGRRFQSLGFYKFGHGQALAIDDYAHHPRELAATIKAARQSMPNNRLVFVFQPHRYTRTRDLFEDFVDVLAEEVDVLVMLRVYTAGEKPIPHADSRSLCRSIRQRGKLDPIFVTDNKELGKILDQVLLDDDLVVFSGAGNIGVLARELIASKEVEKSNG